MLDELNTVGLDWGIFTNGISLTSKIAEKLFRARPGFFRVSLDAGDAELHGKIYGIKGEETFDTVISNIVTAGKIAAKLGYNWFGVGFAVMPNVSVSSIDAMRETFIYLIERSGMGVNFASFRPRVVHYRGGEVVIPQRWSGQYSNLAQEIRERFVEPVEERYGNAVRIDHKYGAFVDCDRATPPTGGWGGSWIATLDHRGFGSIISHIAGAANNPTEWGSALAKGSFLQSWQSDRRRTAQQMVIDEAVKLPVANGFRALDAFLNRIREAVPEQLDDATVDHWMKGIDHWPFHRSKRPVFVG